MKPKSETTVKERYQQLLDGIKIDVLNIEQQHPSGQDIITIPMTPITNSSFNKNFIWWELIHRRLLHLSDGVMNTICRHQTITGLPNRCPKKLNWAPCKIIYTANMTTFPKGTTVDTNNLQPGKLPHMDFSFYNVTSIRGLFSVLTVLCAKTRMLWVLITTSKWSPVHIIYVTLKKLKNEQHSWKLVGVDEDYALANSVDVANLPVDQLRNSMETTSGDASWMKGNNEIQNRSIHNMVISGLLDIIQHKNKWCYVAET